MMSGWKKLGNVLDIVLQVIDMLLHVDKYLGTVIQQYGAWVYAILFAIVFAETGLVVAPFLPGDSLLFIAGAFCATGAMNEWVLIGLLLVAAIGGNTVNYWVGSWIGPKVFDHQWRFLDQQALRKTHDFYERHGGKTLVIARFVPIVRTFAPFVAGVSQMTFARFQLFNVVGAVTWVVGLVFAGYFFGNLPFIKQYLNLIVLVGISAAIVPLILGGLWRLVRRGDKRRRVS
jgi:membrane-associated protein